MAAASVSRAGAAPGNNSAVATLNWTLGNPRQTTRVSARCATGGSAAGGGGVAGVAGAAAGGGPAMRTVTGVTGLRSVV